MSADIGLKSGKTRALPGFLRTRAPILSHSLRKQGTMGRHAQVLVNHERLILKLNGFPDVVNDGGSLLRADWLFVMGWIPFLDGFREDLNSFSPPKELQSPQTLTVRPRCISFQFVQALQPNTRSRS